jgi:hypothetical protein
MLCRKIYETRKHGLCGTVVPGVKIDCEYSQTKCSLDCSSQCSGYEENGATQKPTTAQKRHNQEFIEYSATAPVRNTPIVPSKITPTAPAIVQNNAKQSIPQQANSNAQSSGCGCGGASKRSYTAATTASYVR